MCVCQCFGKESNCRGKAIFGVSCFPFFFQFEGGKRHVQNNNNTSYPPWSTGQVSCPNIHKCTHQYTSSARLHFNPFNPRGSSHYANVFPSASFVKDARQRSVKEVMKHLRYLTPNRLQIETWFRLNFDITYDAGYISISQYQLWRWLFGRVLACVCCPQVDKKKSVTILWVLQYRDIHDIHDIHKKSDNTFFELFDIVLITHTK